MEVSNGTRASSCNKQATYLLKSLATRRKPAMMCGHSTSSRAKQSWRRRKFFKVISSRFVNVFTFKLITNIQIFHHTDEHQQTCVLFISRSLATVTLTSNLRRTKAVKKHIIIFYKIARLFSLELSCVSKNQTRSEKN